jgi:hypothetical protein
MTRLDTFQQRAEQAAEYKRIGQSSIDPAVPRGGQSRRRERADEGVAARQNNNWYIITR